MNKGEKRKKKVDKEREEEKGIREEIEEGNGNNGRKERQNEGKV